ncbi:MAG: DUF1801 domain-containing protein [Gammaproteobacteria bacterium]|nr:DUF1801 domain-containing protein [Gammaproteobacteria bacterium]MDH4316064.1 DUF1801 domain-containing protein [Gammaproteobacteria bacterium]MDH5213910.1 DUF1801 domain-containing protein [Gammaproteobacteria bacterium]
MAELKTRQTEASVGEFLQAVKDEQKRADCKLVSKMMREVTGKPAKMWGSSIVGFGSYDYKYESGRTGSWMLCGFSPRKQDLTIYIMSGFSHFPLRMKKLGKFKTGKSCLYVKSLADVDLKELKGLIADSVKYMRDKYETR